MSGVDLQGAHLEGTHIVGTVINRRAFKSAEQRFLEGISDVEKAALRLFRRKEAKAGHPAGLKLHLPRLRKHHPM